MELFGIVGAGGFGREVMPLARNSASALADGRPSETVFVVENPSGERAVNGHRIMSLAEFSAQSASPRRFNIAIADHAVRKRIALQLIDSGATPFSIAASSAVRLDNNSVGDGSIFCHFTIVTSNAKIGRFFHCNIYSYVAHDCVIGDFVTFAPGVHCNGRVVVGDGAYIGTGAVIRPGADGAPLVIGAGAVVGMGAVVTRSVPAFTTVVGNPAVKFER